MDVVEESMKSSPAEGIIGLFKHVFNFDEDNKANLLNMLQYTLIAILPIFLSLKAIKNMFPEEDDTKGNLELLIESVGQIVVIMLSIWFTHKFVDYIPTYSGNPYSDVNCICFVAPFLILLTTMQTKLGAKLNILFERAVDYWEGNSDKKGQAKPNSGAIRVSQPGIGQPPPQHQPSQADQLDMNNLIPKNVNTGIPTVNYSVNQTANQPANHNIPQSGNDNSMGSFPNSQDVSRGQNSMLVEPMAANEGFASGSAW
jgi:hypothetical protein